MPNDPLLWIGAALLVAVVIIFAIWAGSNVSFSLSADGLRFKTSDKKSAGANPDSGSSQIRVAEGADLKGAFSTIAGVTGAAPPGAVGSVEVAKNAKIDGTVGEIVGLKTGVPDRRDG
jgi:hypothetical protein